MKTENSPRSPSWVRAVDALGGSAPLSKAALHGGRRRLRVLAYHAVQDPGPFSAQLDWLDKHTSLVTLEQVRRAFHCRESLPDRPVLLTFDDGDRSVLDVAAPMLQRRSIPAVAFVIADLIDTDEPFWWAEVAQLTAMPSGPHLAAGRTVAQLKRVPDSERRALIEGMRERSTQRLRTPQLSGNDLHELERAGVKVGNHSSTHPCLDTCDPRTVRQEIVESHERLTRLLGHAPAAFAYPNGNWNLLVRREVREAGYPLAFAFDHRTADLWGDPLVVSRLRVDASEGIERFRLIVSGVHPRLHHLRGRS